ncbi:trimeric intracellular cation channel family protein [Aliiruegeria sabulilitoris]|uniref:trimeric intracellular cation channel family protein n=1 Tax=Aliiruegeria sabulilitoris TaxID=1510458 RepID=UPI00082F1D80|nr:trimeric intracellular cation channel family protein [Aliiruegeria sabulilitoris]NDR56023.1 trimeric intracellular cation channel family protein [Pseudoruegeria sp. M32A2M]
MLFSHLTLALTILATAAMAASAAVQAVRQEFDLYGATVLAFATALGGGTVRDMLLGRTPVFWITDLTYIATAIPVAVLCFFLADRMEAGGGRRLRLLMYLDAMGLALFTLIGTRIALMEDTSAIIAVLIGCITGTVGGMIRDLLSNITPVILKKDLYATISLAGGAIFILLSQVGPEWMAILVAFIGMLAARIIVILRAV